MRSIMWKHYLRVFVGFFLLTQVAYAAPGKLFKVTSLDNASLTVNMSLCLNAKGPLSCQKYSISGSSFEVKTTPPRNYPFAGIKINTPGLKVSGCKPISNGYCMFAVSDTAGATLSVSNTHITAPSKPRNIQVYPGDSEALVTWEPPVNNGGSPLTFYTVTATPHAQLHQSFTDQSSSLIKKFFKASAASPQTLTCFSLGDAPYCLVIGLSSCCTYTFEVVASNAVSTSAPIQSLNPVATTTDIPSEPRFISARPPLDLTKGYITLRWQPPERTGASGTYITNYLVTGIPYTVGSCKTGDLFECNIPPREGFANFQVRAVNSAGVIGSSGTVSYMTTQQNTSQSAISANAENGSVTVNIVRTSTDTRSYKVTSPQSSSTCTVSYSQNSCTITGLTNGKAYQFKATDDGLIVIGDRKVLGPTLPLIPRGPVPSSAKVQVVSGDNQRIAINSISALPLTVLVTDSAGTPLLGVPVNFSSSPYGAVLGTGGTTDNNGRVALFVQANQSSWKTYSITASTSGTDSVATFHLTNTLVDTRLISGSAQSVPVNTQFSSELKLQVIDENGAPVSGIRVTAQAPATGASALLSQMNLITDSQGYATVTAVANQTAGSYQVLFSIPGISPSSFQLTNTPGPAANFVITEGANQSATQQTSFSTPLKVKLADASGNPISGATIHFAVPSSGASAVLSQSDVTTNAQGVASVTAVANATAGAYTVLASVQGSTVNPVSFSLTNLVGGPARFVLVSGSDQRVMINSPLLAPLVAQVLDSGNNPIPGVVVNFTAPASGASVTFSSNTATTGANGQVSITATSNAVGGSYVATAKVANSTQTLDFNLINVASATLSYVSGSNQSTKVNSLFAENLVAKVVDSGGNPVSSALLQVTVPSSGASAGFETTRRRTDNQGLLSLSTFSNRIPGSYAVSITGQNLSGAANYNLTNLAGDPQVATVVAGSNQSAIVNTAYGTSLRVLIRDAFNNPIPNASVTFSTPSSGASGTFSSNPVTTNNDGIASIVFTANGTTGAFQVTAKTGNIEPATFSLKNISSAVIAVQAGSNQNATVKTAFGTALQVKVVDASNNPIPGFTINFSPPSSGASAVLSATSAMTNASGIASVSATANATSGTYTVSATGLGASGSAAFNLTNKSGPASSAAVESGSDQSAQIKKAFSNPLIVVVKDSLGNPVPGVTVTYTVPTSGASATLSSTTATTGANGQASVVATANSVLGTYDVSASVSGIATPVHFSLTNIVGAPGELSIVSGSGQSTVVNQPFTSALTVKVTDNDGNPTPGATVNFSVPSTGASASLSASSGVANSNGEISITVTANTVAGAYQVHAVAANFESSVDFNLTNTAASPSSIVVQEGSEQQALLNAAFTKPLQVQVIDNYNNPVSGATVSFVAPGSGASATLSSSSAATNSSGIASITATANSTAGSYQVTASVAGVGTSAVFNLSNLSVTMAVQSGTSQSAIINNAFGAPLSVRLIDQNSNPVSGLSVTFTAPTTGSTATLSAGTAVTDSNGVASVTATANGTSGTYTVSAALSGVAPVSFSLTNVASATIAVQGGSGQSVNINTAFASTLQAIVKDGSNNPVSGVTVTFTVPGSGAGAVLSANTAVTNGSGVASVTATANAVTGTYTVSATAPGVTGAASFSLTNLAAASIATLSGSPQTTIVNAQFQNALVAKIADVSNNPVPGVTVTFTAPSSGASATFSSSTAVTNSNGEASVTAIANNSLGAYVVSATAEGYAGTATFNLTNNPVQTSTLVYSSRNPTPLMQLVIYSAQVTSPQGTPVAGTVSFTSNGSSIAECSAVALVAGMATCTTSSPTTQGTYNIVASFSGDDIYAASTSQSFSHYVAALSPPATAPSEPMYVTASPGNGSVQLSWLPPQVTGGVDISTLTYTVTYGVNGTLPYNTAAAGCNPTSPGALSCTVSGLSNGTSYVFRVKATNSTGTAPYLNAYSSPVTPSANLAVSTRTLALSARGPGKARMIQVTNGSASDVTISTITGLDSLPSGTSAVANTCVDATLTANGGSCFIQIKPGTTVSNYTGGTTPCTSSVTTGTALSPAVVTVQTESSESVSTNVYVVDYGCQYQGGYLFDIDDSTPITASIGGKVASAVDLPAVKWSTLNTYTLWAVNETSTVFSPSTNDGQSTPTVGQLNCNGATEGSCTSNNILVASTSSYPAATQCSGLLNAAGATCASGVTCYTGWYLPAMCEMGFAGDGATACGSSPGIISNLTYALSMLHNVAGLDNDYWTATGCSGNGCSSRADAWYAGIYSTANGVYTSDINSDTPSRCARRITQ